MNHSMPYERTVFLMFSKGYTVSESELREFITEFFGDCIESLKMSENQGAEKPLFAQIVFYSRETVDLVLDDHVKGRLIINGKHVYVRRVF